MKGCCMGDPSFCSGYDHENDCCQFYDCESFNPIDDEAAEAQAEWLRLKSEEEK